LPHMVSYADAIKAPGLGCLGNPGERGAKLVRTYRPTKIIDVKSQFHVLLLLLAYSASLVYPSERSEPTRRPGDDRPEGALYPSLL
jgi:hypothetical protein